MDLRDLIERALVIRQHYADYERVTYGRAWTKEDIAFGFVGDVGDLMKLVLADKGIRAIPDADVKFGHELADCLWSVLVLAHLYNVDLEQVFIQTMNELEGNLLERQRQLQ